jgi:hypothetical protein
MATYVTGSNVSVFPEGKGAHVDAVEETAREGLTRGLIGLICGGILSIIILVYLLKVYRKSWFWFWLFWFSSSGDVK